MTVKLHHYTRMIETFLIPRVQNLSGHESLCLQQGSTMAHALRITVATLHSLFPLWVISYFVCVPASSFTQCNCFKPFFSSVPFLFLLGIGKQ
jgi:hypothetical protein